MSTENIDRRNFLKTCAFTTGVVGLSLEEKTLLAQETKARESKQPSAVIALPTGRIGKRKISRLICGGNLINGYTHARDMIYISELLKHDNMWCMDPDRTIKFMKTCEKPWIAYKVLAAGIIHPTDGFQYAFESGADFACVGMCDFQVREDAILANKTLTSLTRPHP